MEKPKAQTITYLDYFRVKAYIEFKYKVSLEEVIDYLSCYDNIHNGSFITLCPDKANVENMRGKENIAYLISLIFDEFGEYGDKYGDLNFKVYWW